MSPTILQAPDPRLAQVAVAAPRGTRELAHALLDAVCAAGGAGLAAPQIGVAQRVIVVVPRAGIEFLTLDDVWWNPQIILRSAEVVTDWEACLSVPGVRGKVPRAQHVTVTYHRYNPRRIAKTFECWVPHTEKCSGWRARVAQHEIDHLDGILFTARATTTTRAGAGPERAV